MLASSHIFQLLNMTTWCVGAMPLNVQPKLKRNDYLALVIWTSQAEYAKAFKGACIDYNWKYASNKIVQHKKIGLFM
jgi:hypothetical protein